MQRLHYAGSSITSGDDITKAVLRYARALAVAQKSDVISIPIVTNVGTRSHAHILIGPASELFTTNVDGEIEEIVAPETVASLEKQTLAMNPDRPAWPLEIDDVAHINDFIDDL